MIIFDFLRLTIRVLVAMSLAYLIGIFIDNKLVLNITPILIFIVPLFVITPPNITNFAVGDFLLEDFALPLTVLMIVALTGNLIFTETTNNFLNIIGYNGSIYSVSFVAGIMLIILRAIYTLIELVGENVFRY